MKKPTALREIAAEVKRTSGASLAKRIGKTRAYVSGLLRQRWRPSFETAGLLADQVLGEQHAERTRFIFELLSMSVRTRAPSVAEEIEAFIGAACTDAAARGEGA